MFYTTFLAIRWNLWLIISPTTIFALNSFLPWTKSSSSSLQLVTYIAC
jgi:hypothetical protein